MKHLVTAASLAASVALCAAVLSGAPRKQTAVVSPGRTVVRPQSFDTLWQRIEAFENQGLSRSALALVDTVMDVARRASRSDHLVKAVIFGLKYQAQLEDDALAAAIARVHVLADSARFPVRPVLHSLLAQMYWSYYQTNRWRFADRSVTVNYVPDDLQTWDLQRIVDQVTTCYRLSLGDVAALQSTPVDTLGAVLITGDSLSRAARPTLYDFLAHRALEFFMDTEPGLSRPAQRFELDDPEWFAAAPRFCRKTVTVVDTASLELHAVRILQDLLKFHLHGRYPHALLDADLVRLAFVNRRWSGPGADSLYLAALRQRAQAHRGKPGWARVMAQIAQELVGAGELYGQDKAPEKRWLLRQAAHLCDSVIRHAPEGSDEGVAACQSLAARIRHKELNLTVQEAIEPASPTLMRLEYRNLRRVHCRVVKDDPFGRFENRYQETTRERLAELAGRPAVAQWSQDLPDAGDFQMHAVEIGLPPLAPGYYTVLVSDTAGFVMQGHAVAAASLWATRITLLQRSTETGEIEGAVLDRMSGAPLEKVSVQVWVSRYVQLKRQFELVKGTALTTDANGRFRLARNKDWHSFFVEIKKGDDRYCSDYLAGGYPRTTREVSYQQTVFFTDRAIYRPGQTIYFKGLLLKRSGREVSIVPRASTTVTLYDVNAQKVEERTLVSNEYGTVSGTFTAPTGRLTGRMSIRNQYGSCGVLVEEYKRPRFEVVLDTVKNEHRLGDTVRISGLARAYTGAALDDAQVSWRVVRRAVLPPWFLRCFWWYVPTPPSEVAQGQVRTDGTGILSFSFVARPDRAVTDNPRFQFEVFVDVTDINGETRSGAKSVTLGSAALTLDLQVPDFVEPGRDTAFTVLATNCEGQVRPLQGTVTISRLTQPKRLLRPRPWLHADTLATHADTFATRFPRDPLIGEDDMTRWKKEKPIATLPFNTAKDSLVGGLPARDLTPGVYVLEAVGADRSGTPVRAVSYCTVWRRQESRTPVQSYDFFIPPATRAEVGDTVRFTIGSAARQVRVRYELEVAEKVAYSSWITLDGTQQTIAVAVGERHRGNFTIHCTFVKDNRCFRHQAVVSVPFTNKQLQCSWSTFRDRLEPGGSETWNLTVRGPKGDRVAAEVMATLYDASLDQFTPHRWGLSLYSPFATRQAWSSRESFDVRQASLWSEGWNESLPLPMRRYDELNFFGYYPGSVMAPRVVRGGALARSGGGAKADMMTFAAAAPAPEAELAESAGDVAESKKQEIKPAVNDGETLSGPPAAPPVVRGDLRETAFFLPQLRTDEQGNVVLAFNVPQALTRWNFMALAHTADLSVGQLQAQTITRRELMVVPNMPRFLREGDTLSLVVKVTSLAQHKQQGSARLELYDVVSGRILDTMLAGGVERPFTVPAQASVALSWKLAVPEGISAIRWKATAAAGEFSDGEEAVLPVLSSRMLVTEALPLLMRGVQQREFVLKKLAAAGSSATLRHQSLTLEYCANPAWYAVQSLPYLMEYPHECAEQVWSRFYANTLASHIANKNPRIRKVFDAWRTLTPDALASQLEKNQELKELFLAQTPWVVQAQDEAQRKRSVAVLFDLNRMAQHRRSALQTLTQLHLSNGGWPWFGGMPDDRYITQLILTGFSRLESLGVGEVRSDPAVAEMLRKAIGYCDRRIVEDWRSIMALPEARRKENHLGALQIQYLFARSVFLGEMGLDGEVRTAHEYYRDQATRFWNTQPRGLQAMLALALHRGGKVATSQAIIRSLGENAIRSDELGMYWNDIAASSSWDRAPVESMALLAQAFDEAGGDTAALEGIKTWLLKNKQTNDWKSTRATADACFALLLRGQSWLDDLPKVDIRIGAYHIGSDSLARLGAQAGSGYFKRQWPAAQVEPAMATVRIKKSDPGPAWGALYWQYLEQVDKITAQQTPLKVAKNFFVQRTTPAGPVIEPLNARSTIKIGDRVVVRIELRVDRAMEYVHLMDMRAAGLEPEDVLSGCRWQDGLHYYMSTRDARTDLFFGYLPKGAYVFEYRLRAAQQGAFATGIASAQCMYAPEFSAHSAGGRLKIQ